MVMRQVLHQTVLGLPIALLVLGGCVSTKEVAITSEPEGATILIDGVPIGMTPVTKHLSFSGDEGHTVLLKKEGYEDRQLTVTLDPREKTTYTMKLKELGKTILITSEPAGAEVFLGDTLIGKTPVRQELTFAERKEYQAVLKKEGYEDGRLLLAREPRDLTTYHAKLKRLEITSVDLVSFEPQPTEKGLKLAITHRPTLAYFELIERSPNVQSVTRVTANDDKALQIGSPVLSPVDDVVAYSVVEQEEKGSSRSNIWKQAIGSSNRTLITFGKWLDLFPSFTPDGQYLVFSSNRASSNPTLWRVKLVGGGGIMKVTSGLTEDYAPSVSPQGDHIAYTSNPPGTDEPQIWTTDSKGGMVTQLRVGESPQVSWDGRKLVFVRKDMATGRKQLWMMNMDGSEETLFSQNSDHDEIDPRWSPDGKWIVFTSSEGLDAKKNQNFDIWLMAADGSKRSQLTTNGSRDDSPAWHRNGKTIYFRSNRGGTWNIWRLEVIFPS